MSDLTPKEVAAVAVAAARAGKNVLIVYNTVGDAQLCYQYVRAISGDLPIGLLHSQFSAGDRDKREAHWTEVLGPTGVGRPKGSVLVSTQVVEQSVDLDADLLITELAPTDMILQRIGRLWRHPRFRPWKHAEVKIISKNLTAYASDAKALCDAIGDCQHVYAPFVLWKTYQVLRDVTSITIPNDMRPLLEATYAEELAYPPAIEHLKVKMEARIEVLRNLAANAMIEDQPPLPDTEDHAPTRHCAIRQINVLLIKSVRTGGGCADITLMDGSVHRLSAEDISFRTRKAIHESTVHLPLYFFLDTPRNPAWLHGTIYEDTIALSVADDGALIDEIGRTTQFRYDEELGVYDIKKITKKQNKDLVVVNYDTIKEAWNEFD
jgi:CRISPR-associated endonuclease/helicase Cas3